MGHQAANGSSQAKPYKFLIYGETGRIGGVLGRLCQAQGIGYAYGSGRLENRESIFGQPGVRQLDPSLQRHKRDGQAQRGLVETIRANMVGTLTLADLCREKGLVLINYATGCIFEYDSGHPLGSDVGSFYSKTKAMVEDLLKNYENVCTLCVRMPISFDLSNPRNFITKICAYEKVVNIPNSMTILEP
ncbi:hypothetical protein RJ640_005179 [Escallonia rubra]|uniref:NAD-dependent epimerase/dehydratase domain-containing protein n=1 Tax=Escallonia rubra TaxID=112253 RepID=A0AA88UT19_9ASTE|nr:hypothetical protein RJ640_005179 [Escallonia rubra]